MIKLNDDIFFWGGGGFIAAICSLSLFVQVGGKGGLNTLSIKKIHCGDKINLHCSKWINSNL